jgi:hypothetical protein
MPAAIYASEWWNYRHLGACIGLICPASLTNTSVTSWTPRHAFFIQAGLVAALNGALIGTLFETARCRC